MNAVRPIPALPHYNFVERMAALPFVDAIILYGSRARGEARERSDIDLAISAPSASVHEWQTLLEIIDDADTLLGIDCVRLDRLGANEPLRHNIEADGITLYRRNDAR